uniref:Uncharacterized protein n=1 Tax=Timema cristinae TaxID=61476 RepID=A0A7R9D699_TIMCR|nr:unnamed protein product [Timema cristinae]
MGEVKTSFKQSQHKKTARTSTLPREDKRMCNECRERDTIENKTYMASPYVLLRRRYAAEGLRIDGSDSKVLAASLYWLNEWESKVHEGKIIKEQFLSKVTADGLIDNSVFDAHLKPPKYGNYYASEETSLLSISDFKKIFQEDKNSSKIEELKSRLNRLVLQDDRDCDIINEEHNYSGVPIVDCIVYYGVMRR